MKDIIIKMPLEELPDSFSCMGDWPVARHSHIIVDGHDISGTVTCFEVKRLADDFAFVTLTLVGRVVFEDTRDDMTDADRLRIVATWIAEGDSGYRGEIENDHTETARKIIRFLERNGRN